MIKRFQDRFVFPGKDSSWASEVFFNSLNHPITQSRNGMSTRRHCAAHVLAAALLASLLPGAPAQAADAHQPDAHEAMAVLQAICPGNVQTSKLKHGMAYGCGSCPDFTGFKGEKSGPGEGSAFELRAVMQGAFARAGASELLAEFFGCEPHANNFGGTLLLRQSGAAWRRVSYAPGMIGLVRSFRLKNDRDLVLERGGYTGQGETTEWVSTHDFAAKGDSAEHTLLSLQDTSLLYCESESVQIGDFAKLEFPDLNGDGLPDLRITVRSGKVTVPAMYHGNCEKPFKPPQVPTYQIDFLFDGKTFHVSPQSAGTLRRVSAENK